MTQTYKVGDILVVRLKGDINTYVGELIDNSPPRIKIHESTKKFIDVQDFIIQAEDTIRFQEDPINFVKKRRVMSGLKIFGVTGYYVAQLTENMIN